MSRFYQICEFSDKLLPLVSDKNILGRIKFLKGSVDEPHRYPIQKSLKTFQEGILVQLETGDMEYLGHSLALSVINSYLGGNSLVQNRQLLKKLDSNLEHKEMSQDIVFINCSI